MFKGLFITHGKYGVRAALLGAFQLLSASALVVLLMNPSAGAQQLEPRAYANLPVGLNFLFLSYSHSSGAILFDSAFPVRDVQAKIHDSFVAYLRALDLGGRSAKVTVVIPHDWLSVSGNVAGIHRRRDVSGFGDPALGFTVNLFGAPALNAKEFVNYRQNLNIGVSFLMRMPLGRYDVDKFANIGTNRWAFLTEAGLSKALGRWIFESSLAATVFTPNEQFLVEGEQDQAPIYALQLHGVYNFPSEVWVAVDGTFYAGGASTTTLGGKTVRQVGRRNTRIGGTVSLPINKRNSIRLHASTSGTTRTGNQFDVLSVTWQYRWGAGI